MNEQPNDLDAAQALAAVDRTRAALLERIAWGSWRYDLTYSVLAAGVVMSQALPPPLNVLADAVVIVSLAALARWWRARTGVWISGVTPRRARWVALAIGLLAGAAAIATAIAARQGQAWIALVLGPVIGVLALGGSRLWRRVHRDEVQAGVAGDSTGRRNWVWPLVGLGLICAVAAGVLAVNRTDSYVVGLFVGVALALIASPGLIALKRRVLFR